MDTLEPLAAFQALCLTLAVSIGIDARKQDKVWRYGLWVASVLLAGLGIFAARIGAAWPASLAFMQDLGGSAIPWFVLAVGVYFAVRPRCKKSPSQPLQSDNNETLRLQREMENLSQALGGVLADNQNMRGLEARFTDTIDKLKLHVREESNAWRSADKVLAGKLSELEKLAEKVESVRVEGAINSQDLKNLGTATALLKKSFVESRYAIYVRELLDILSKEIEEDAAILSAKIDGGDGHDATSWGRWENVHHHWQGRVHGWCNTGRWYAPAIRDRIFNVADAEYEGEWHLKDNQFPNADAVRKYKRHRIIQNHWEEIRAEVMDGVRRVAFEGTSERETNGGKFHQTDE